MIFGTSSMAGRAQRGTMGIAATVAVLVLLASVASAAWGQQKPRANAKPRPAPAAVQADSPVAPAGTDSRIDDMPLARADSPVDDYQVWLQAAPPANARSYRLGTGDVVRLLVFQQPDMTLETRVSDAGTITVPLLGPVQIGTGTTKQAEARIAALLRARGFVRDPQINVTVVQFKSQQISVLGYVNRPGRYALEEGPYRVTDALSLAGGVVPGAADVVTVVRAGEGRTMRYEVDIPRLFESDSAEGNFEIRGGDSLYVDKAPIFYIYGEVQRPGSFRLEKDMTVMQALSVGGGLNPRGTEKNMRLTRRDANGRQVTLTPGMSDPIQPDDVIYVRESMF